MQVIWRYGRFNLNLELEYKTCGGKCVFREHSNGTLFCFLIQNGFQFRNFTLSCCANSEFYFVYIKSTLQILQKKISTNLIMGIVLYACTLNIKDALQV